MKKEEFSKISRIHGELRSLEELIDKMKGCSPSSGMEVECKTGYSDMGRDITRTIKIDGDIALKCFSAMREVLEKSLIKAQKQFDAITINGL